MAVIKVKRKRRARNRAPARNPKASHDHALIEITKLRLANAQRPDFLSAAHLKPWDTLGITPDEWNGLPNRKRIHVLEELTRGATAATVRRIVWPGGRAPRGRTKAVTLAARA